MASNITTNFKDQYGVDIGFKLLSKEYLLEVYPEIGNQLISPELWIWGRNNYAQLGNNTTTPSSTPVTTFLGGSDWKMVSCGSEGSAAIKKDGSLWIWGRGINGRLGTNSTSSSSTPVTTFLGGNDWKFVNTVGEFTGAIKTDGSLWTWGLNYNGQLGINDKIDRLTPVTTSLGGNDWKEVRCSNFNMIAIKTDGSLWTWGGNAQGQLGCGDVIERLTPVNTTLGGNDWYQCDSGTGTGGTISAAIKNNGSLWIWGSSNSSGLGINSSTPNRLTPVPIFGGGGDNWKYVSIGGNSASALKTDGSLWTWGLNSSGQLGVNDTINRPTPVTTFIGGFNWKRLVMTSATLAIKTDGTLWVWGNNGHPRLGIGSAVANVLTPVTTFLGGNNWKDVDSRSDNSIAIRSTDLL
jgi:alpha-tubulin suppressor-like RCC1 family protein